jgi:hypothetical protein
MTAASSPHGAGAKHLVGAINVVELGDVVVDVFVAILRIEICSELRVFAGGCAGCTLFRCN